MNIILVGGPEGGQTQDNVKDTARQILRMHVNKDKPEIPKVLYDRTDKVVDGRVVFEYVEGGIAFDYERSIRS